jgi:hypothetical protein
MSKVGKFFIRFFGGLAFAFMWSLFSVFTGIYKQSQTSALHGWGIFGFFFLGYWLSKKFLDRPKFGKNKT